MQPSVRLLCGHTMARLKTRVELLDRQFKQQFKNGSSTSAAHADLAEPHGQTSSSRVEMSPALTGAANRMINYRSNLLSKLRAAHVDDCASLMHEVIVSCSVDALAALSATSRWHHKHCRTCLLHFEKQHLAMAIDLAARLGYFSMPSLQQVRALTIPDTLPDRLRPLLGKWLRTNGRLSRVDSVRCRSWIREGEVLGWIDLDPVRAGEPERLSPDERQSLEKLDTPDGLLKTVLQHAH